VDKSGATRIFRLIEALEDSDDVQNVFGNFDVPDDVMPRSTEPSGASDPGSVAVGG
jgi:hypothetical protein